MNTKPHIIICMRDDNCYIHQLLAKTPDNDKLAARILDRRVYGDTEELWIVVRGPPTQLRSLDATIRAEKDLRYQCLQSTKHSRLYRIIVPKGICRNHTCPLDNTPPAALLKSIIVTPRGLIVEYIVAKHTLRRELEAQGYRILEDKPIAPLDTGLTPKQEEILVEAYLKGYYNYPRKINLRQLARELGVSVSTLAEQLRKAEAKVVEAYVHSELPHYIHRRE